LKSSDVSQNIASVFKVEEYAEQETSRACHLLHADLWLGLFFDSEDVGDMFLRNVG
jgi:hypothetical protein